MDSNESERMTAMAQAIEGITVAVQTLTPKEIVSVLDSVRALVESK
jgi:predicted ATPase